LHLCLLILSRIQTSPFVDCTARLLTVLIVLLRRRSFCLTGLELNAT